MVHQLQPAFEIFQDREHYFEKVGDNNYPHSLMLSQSLMIMATTFFYGAIMGSYNSPLQAMASGGKLVLLILLTLVICFPSFYIVQLVLGSKIKLRQLITIVLSGFVMTTTVLVAFAPIVFFFQVSGSNYAFLQLLHVAIFGFAGFFGMRAILEMLKNACEKTHVYPKIGLKIFKIWIIIFAFVGMQLSWNLRPFIGTKEMPFELFRANTSGNFYTNLATAFGNLLGGETKNTSQPTMPTVPPANQ